MYEGSLASFGFRKFGATTGGPRLRMFLQRREGRGSGVFMLRFDLLVTLFFAHLTWELG